MDLLKAITVLITAAGNVFMPGTTACLKENGERTIRLIGVDMNDDPSILKMCDAYYQVPRGDDPSYIDALLEICKKESVDIVLPIMSSELNALAKNREQFERNGTRVSVSDYKRLRIANNKLQLFNFMVETGIPCAEYEAVHSLEELDEAVYKLGYPEKQVCLKSVSGSGSRGFRILDEMTPRYEMFMYQKPSICYSKLSEMRQILAEAPAFPELLVMEYLPGKEYTVDLLADHGKILYVCCRRSLGMENSIMLNCIVEENSFAKNLCQSVTEALELDGNIGFDLLENESGTPYIVECNPRITAGIPVFEKAGVNLPYLNVKRMLGEELPKVKLKTGTVVRRRWMEM